MSIEQSAARRDESTAGSLAMPQRPVSKAFITIDQLREFGKRGKWGKKDHTDSTKRAELDIEMFTSKSCETHKAGPCPPDCPHTLNKDTGMSKSLGKVSKGHWGDGWLEKYKGTSLIDSAIKLAEEYIDIEEERLKSRRSLMSRHDEKLWRKEDKLRLAKQRLDLRLAKVQAKDVKKSVTSHATDILKAAASLPVPQNVSSNEELSKALTTRNFAMPRISAMRARYDANQIVRSAMTQTTRDHSALAPPVQDTLNYVAQTEPARTQPILRSLCAAHGLAFKSDQGCHACTVAKSLETVRPDVRHHLR